MNTPFKKNIEALPLEEAHGGSGKRKLILSKIDGISKHVHAMTKGYLEAGAIFDWHKHDEIDEFMLVLKGTGEVNFKDTETIAYVPGDLVYLPANMEHAVKNTGSDQNEFYFLRVDA